MLGQIYTLKIRHVDVIDGTLLCTNGMLLKTVQYRTKYVTNP